MTKSSLLDELKRRANEILTLESRVLLPIPLPPFFWDNLRQETCAKYAAIFRSKMEHIRTDPRNPENARENDTSVHLFRRSTALSLIITRELSRSRDIAAYFSRRIRKVFERAYKLSSPSSLYKPAQDCENIIKSKTFPKWITRWTAIFFLR